MIYDRLNNSNQYDFLGQNFKKAFDFLLTNNLKTLENGKYIIDDDKIYANVQSLKTKSEGDKKWEAHRKYIDIQYVIDGEEKIGYGILEDFNTICDYDNDRDVVFLDGNIYNFINLKAGDFVIFYPQDVHAPMLFVNKEQNIKKVIVKIAI